MPKFNDRVKVAGRHYSRWGITGTFSTTRDAVEKYKDKFIIAEGVVRWKSNNQIPFGDMLLDFCESGLCSPKQVRVSSEIREKETDEFWERFGLGA